MFSGLGGEQRRPIIEAMGHEYITMDYDGKFNPNIAVDVFEFDIDKYGRFDFIWASPPCESFSVSSIGHHWHRGGIPKTDNAIYAKKLLAKTLEIIRHANPYAYLIENPMGMMRKMPELFMVPRSTVTYCQYGDFRMKPTDLFGVVPGWTPRPACHKGDPCHVAAPRGSRTGTQGMRSYADKSVVPIDLWVEIINAIAK